MIKKIKIPRMLLNSVTGVVASAISTISIYCIRIVISHVLGEEIYGINSIFISIVSALLILELGMSTAVIIVLYKPVSENNKELIKSILQYFRNFYRLFCLFIIAVGSVITLFFLKYFVNSNVALFEIQIYFMLYVISIGLKYLWSYKLCLLYANKKNSVVSLITIFNTVFFTIVQVLCIKYFKQYWIYLLLYLAQNVFQNVLCNIYTNKCYGFIKEGSVNPISKTEKEKLKGIVRPMFIQRIANQIQDSSSVVVLGAIGTSAVLVGYFSNYIFVVHACQTLFNQVGASFTTSYGNYSTQEKTIEEKYKYYSVSRFYMAWVAYVFATLYLCLIQDFVLFFFGTEYVMADSIAVLLSCYVFIVLNSSINLSTQNAVGAHYLDTKEILFQAVFGIVLSAILGTIWGALGIAVAMIVSVGIFTGIIKGCKIVKNIYQKSSFTHIRLLIIETLEYFIISGICFCLYRFVLKPGSMVLYIVSAMIVFIISNLLIIILNFKTVKKEVARFLK